MVVTGSLASLDTRIPVSLLSVREPCCSGFWCLVQVLPLRGVGTVRVTLLPSLSGPKLEQSYLEKEQGGEGT